MALHSKIGHFQGFVPKYGVDKSPCPHTLVDIYHQPGGFQENILTVVGTFYKESKTNNTSFESPDKELLESGVKLDLAPS